MSAETVCFCSHGVWAHTFDGCGVKDCSCLKYSPRHSADRRTVEQREAAARDEGAVRGFADCEAMVLAMLQKLTAAEILESVEALEKAKNAIDSMTRKASISVGNRCHTRATVMRELELAIRLGQHRSAEYGDSDLASAHQKMANSSAKGRSGGIKSAQGLDGEKRAERARNAAKARWGKKGE